MSTRALTVVGELDRYIAHVNHYPVLSQEEETELAIRWRDHGDIEAAHKLVTSNLKFVVKIANEYRGYHVRLLDLVQEGNVGLMRAIKQFDPNRGYRLLSYAVHWIRAEIRGYLMRTLKSVRLGGSRAQRKLFFKLRSLKGKLAAKGVSDRERIFDIIAAETGVSKEAVEEMDQRLCSQELSLDAPTSRAYDTTLTAHIPDDRPTPETLLSDLETKADLSLQLNTAILTLTPREKEIIAQRYLRDVPMQLKEIGDEWGLSKQRVHQLEQRALRKLKKTLDRAA